MEWSHVRVGAMEVELDGPGGEGNKIEGMGGYDVVSVLMQDTTFHTFLFLCLYVLLCFESKLTCRWQKVVDDNDR